MADNDQTTKDQVVAEESLENQETVAEQVENNEYQAEVAEVQENDVVESNEQESVEVVDKNLNNFNVGDTVVVNYRIKEGDKSRIQPFTGIVIGIKNSGVSKTFTVRRMAVGNIGVERIFPVNSPNIESVVTKSRGKVRRAKLYYLRDRIGKSASKVKRKE